MGVSRVIGENREQVDVLERYLGIVGASTLKLGDSMGEVDLEWSLDGWRSELCARGVDLWSHTTMENAVVKG